MKKISIILIGLVLIVVAILISILNKGKNTEKELAAVETNKQIKVIEVNDIYKLYSLGNCIDDKIQDLCFKGYIYNSDTISCLVHNEILDRIDYKDNKIKEFYIQKAYKADINDNFLFYFAEGYVIDEYNNEQPDEDRAKKEIKLTIINLKKYNFCLLEPYGMNYKDIFNYNDNIEKTTITNKVEDKTNELYKFVDIIENYEGFDIDSERDFYNDDLEKKAEDINLVLWCYQEYANQNPQSTKQLENDKIYTISGDFENGFILNYNEELKYIIKLDKKSTKYEVSEQRR